MCRSLLLLLSVFALTFSLAACDSGGANDEEENASGEDFTFEGQVADYDLGEQRITPNTGASLGEGTLSADGSFTMTLFGAEKIEDELEAVDPEAGAFDSFSGFICEEEAAAALDGDARFAIASALTFTSDIDDDGTSETATLGLTSEAPDIVQPVPNPAAGDYHVRWIFANQPVALDTQCRDGERTVDLELNAGWNEVIYDLSDRDQIRQYTGSRPGAVDWQLDV